MYERFVELLQSKGVTAYKVATDLKMSQSTFSDWKRGKSKPKTDKLQKIADYFGVELDWLAGSSDFKTKAEMYEHFNTTIDLERVKRELADIVNKIEKIEPRTVPVVNEISPSAPIELTMEEDRVEIPSKWRGDSSDYFAMKVKGDSMYPKYLEGDIIIVRKENDFLSGKDCIVSVNGNEVILRTVIINPDSSITLKPNNSTYPPRTYSSREIEIMPIVVCGVVVEMRREV